MSAKYRIQNTDIGGDFQIERNQIAGNFIVTKTR